MIYSDWENRTQTWFGKRPGQNRLAVRVSEHSPIERQPEPPEVDESLSNLTISRETGLMPIPIHPETRLVGRQQGLTLL